MDIKKYKQIPTEFATAKEIGLSAQTLAAYVRRGMAEVLQGSPNRYRRVENDAIKVYNFLDDNKNKIDQYFTIYKVNEKLGMLCSVSGGEVVDCWGNKYNLTGASAIGIKGTTYMI